MEVDDFKSLYIQLFAKFRELKENSKSKWCLAAIDIEHFKIFNEIYGRECGDQLLSDYSKILKSVTDNKKSVTAYLGNDDFLLFTEYDLNDFKSLSDELISAKEKISTLPEFCPNIGVYILDENEKVSFDTYDKAIFAKNEAAANSNSTIYVYDLSLQQELVDEVFFADLERASNNNEITFFVQPQCRISTQDIVRVEVLARWKKPDGTYILPGVFIPILEKNGLISHFDKIIWEKACAWIASLVKKGINPVPVSINVSYYDIMVMDVCAVLTNLCDKYNIPYNLIGIEITETVFAQKFDLLEKLVVKLKSNGFLIFMDDFGSGFSSLNMLNNIQVDVLKLDMAFLKSGGVSTKKNITVIESVINMAKMIGVPIIVEGVENKKQESFLVDTGCRYAQGNYFYAPMDLKAFEKLIDDNIIDRRGFICKFNEQMHVREFLDDNNFTDTMLNNVLGPVAFFSLHGMDLSIIRYNSQFYNAFNDVELNKYVNSIQKYIIKHDLHNLYNALKKATENPTSGGSCEIRMEKEKKGVFWYRFHFFFLKKDNNKSIFYGKFEDITEINKRNSRFVEMLCADSDVAMVINVEQKTIQYLSQNNALSNSNMPMMDLETSTKRTLKTRIESKEDKEKFVSFFDPKRIKQMYNNANYYEKLSLNFKIDDKFEPVIFSSYYVRWSNTQDLIAYVSVKKVNN